MYRGQLSALCRYNCMIYDIRATTQKTNTHLRTSISTAKNENVKLVVFYLGCDLEIYYTYT